ncbi:Cytochrome P450 4C1 [Folsomia candida]|uniref:Cytochrome P450 4C1 n=1 Tax=Folsomia candida TaxID=158441 RepID=A0A226DIL3_FOLCA|nr:Cytochrome P450 4C1 [Folsomia candida]
MYSLPELVSWFGLIDGKFVITFVLAFIIYYLTKRDRRISKFLENVPGPPTIPLFGNALSLLRPRYGLGWLGRGLLTAKARKWRGRRKLLTPTFHFKILEEFSVVFNEQADVLTKILKEKADGKPFNIFPFMARCALDIICETAMGKKLNAQVQQDGDDEYLNAVSEYGCLLLEKITRPWLQIGLIRRLSGFEAKEAQLIKVLHDFTDKVFVIVDDGDGTLTDVEIREETDTFMFAGHDTTSASMSWTILMLSFHENQLHQVF